MKYDICQLQIFNAARACFATKEEKEEILKELQQTYGEYN